MTAISKTSVKAYFETGDFPSQAQFEDLIDSYQNFSSALDDYIASVSGQPSGLFVTTNGTNGVTSVSAGAARTTLGLATTSDVEFNTITVSAVSSKSAVFSGAVTIASANITGNIAVSADATFRNIRVSANAVIDGAITGALLTVGGNVVSASGIAMGGNTLSGPMLYDPQDQFVSSNVGTSYTFDMRIPMHRIVLTTATCSITFTNTTAAIGCRRSGLMAKQDGTGNRKIEWKGTVRAPANTLPTLTTSASTQDRFEIETFDGTTLFLYTCGQNF